MRPQRGDDTGNVCVLDGKDVMPVTASNYAAGLSVVRTRDYLIGTSVGIIPGTIAHVTLGSYGPSPGSWPFPIALIVLVVLTAGGTILARRSHRLR